MAWVLLCAGCSRCEDEADTDPSRTVGWTRHDLLDAVVATDVDVRVRIRFLGQGVPAQPARRAEPQKRRRRMAGEIRAHEAPANHDLRWTLQLGQDPYLSYVPFNVSEAGCRRRYRVQAMGRGGELVDVDVRAAGEPTFFALAAVEIPLDRFAGDRIDLVMRLETEGEGCGATIAAWGRPAVYSRRPIVHRPGTGEQPNIVLLGLDTLRADALGVYGREPSPTPAIDRFAAQSDVWLEAFSTFNVTTPSFASILTGLYGKNHGVYDFQTWLGEEHATLGELLAAAGYETGAIVSAHHLGHRQSGLRRGFETFQAARTQNAAAEAVGLAMEWIVQRRRPFFLWLHLFDPHTPHTPPDPYARGRRPLGVGLGPVRQWTPFREPGPDAPAYDDPKLGGHRDLYTSEVAYTDHQVGRLLDFLDDRGLFENTVIALVADHGENLGEHGIFYRHRGLWDTTTHVPLMIRRAGNARTGRRIPGLVQTLDLFPTLLAAAGVEAPPQDGVDLRRLERGRRSVFAEAAARKGAMIRTPTHFLFLSTHEDRLVGIEKRSYLFDVIADPRQERDLAGTGSEVEARLRAALESWLEERRASGPATSVPLSDEEMRQLRSLGYVSTLR